MGNNELYDRLEYDAIKTDWHAWMSKTAQALRHTDIRRFGIWAELERLSKIYLPCNGLWSGSTTTI